LIVVLSLTALAGVSGIDLTIDGADEVEESSTPPR
jgi:ribose 5-phosphate isomerase